MDETENASLRRLIAQRERELQLISNEIHDDVLQYFVAARMTNDAYLLRLKRAGDCIPNDQNRIRELLDQGIEAARKLMEQLRPIDFLETPLGDCLVSLAHASSLKGKVRFDVQTHVEIEIDEFIQLMLYRIAQETLNNVIRHSGASDATVTLIGAPNERQLSVRDNGRGFDVTAIASHHFGMTSIRERAAIIGGQVDITSSPQGTLVRVTF